VKENESRPVLRALGQRIRELRAAQGYSQEGFADRCGVHRTFMGTIERGESNLSFENIARVAKGLGITLSALFSDLEGRAQGLKTGRSTGATRPTKGRTCIAKRPGSKAV
jgi:transcriptional regulator with XRE-family HTH domain